jgi:formaldehyde-activating enzyme involved in methanogenesis
MVNVNKMVMTELQAIRAIHYGTNNQAMMTSIAETAMEHTPTEEKLQEKIQI